MLRGTFRPDTLTGERFFRWRGGNVSRLEGLADAVFALALTLLVVRLDVPQTFSEVKHAMLHAPVYLACFSLFVWIWYCHHQFHRRYGLEDPLTITLDGAILFVVLLFALPLRFVAEMLYSRARFGGSLVRRDFDGEPIRDALGETLPMIASQDAQLVMQFYAGGFALLFALFTLQYINAYRRREALELDELERIVTGGTTKAHALSAGIGFTSLALCLLPSSAAPLSGLAFFAMGPAHGILGWRQGRKLTRRAAELDAARDTA